VVALLFAAVIGIPQDAQAYLDPGTGSMLLQGLIAGVAGGLAVIGLYWSKFKGFLASRGSKDVSSDASDLDHRGDDSNRS
jgi:hypothetical protein